MRWDGDGKGGDVFYFAVWLGWQGGFLRRCIIIRDCAFIGMGRLPIFLCFCFLFAYGGGLRRAVLLSMLSAVS